jgi:propanediol dehydratase small subunit
MKTIADYPLAETQPEKIKGPRGKTLPELTLRAQAEIAEAANRKTLADNFNRAAELVNVPQDVIMATYELLRPGRAKSKDVLLATAQRFRSEYNAPLMSGFIEEAASVYERRGLFTHRF